MTARVRRQLPLALAALSGVFVIKLSVLLTLGHHPLLVPAGELDGAYYFHFARQVAAGDWMLDDAASFFGRPAPAFFISPLYIYVLALLLKIGGGSLEAARFGQIVLDGGRAADGRRVVSEAALKGMFTRSRTNPAYGRLWWLNGGAYAFRAGAAGRVEGPLIPAAPADTVAALGALDRKLYVVPSRKLVVVRMGRAASDREFDQQLWLRLAKVI